MRIAIIGAGGHAREVLDIVEAQGERPIGFLVETGFGEAGTLVHGVPILGDLDWVRGRRDVRLICGVGAPDVRRRLVYSALKHGAEFANAIHPMTQKTSWLTIGTGVVIASGCILTNEIVLGEHVHINIACTLSHDSLLEDFATLSPGVHVAGGVRVEQGAFVGVGAILLPRIRIGAWSKVGAGAVVTEDVPPNTTVAGVPAKVIQSRKPGWHLES